MWLNPTSRRILAPISSISRFPSIRPSLVSSAKIRDFITSFHAPDPIHLWIAWCVASSSGGMTVMTVGTQLFVVYLPDAADKRDGGGRGPERWRRGMQ